MSSDLRKLASHAQKFGFVIRAYMPLVYAEKSGT